MAPEIRGKLMVYLGLFSLVIALIFLFTFPLMWIANYVFDPKFLTFVFGVPELGYWKMFWLNLFLGCFFVRGQSNTKS